MSASAADDAASAVRVLEALHRAAGLPWPPVAPEPPRYSNSPDLAKFAAAMAKAQAATRAAIKDATNPHFKSRYADLAAVWDACRDALTSNGLSVLQFPTADGARVTLRTTLLHDSGEWMSSDLTMTAQQNTPQGIGSTITYARRYALASCCGIASEEDDDGNAGSVPSSYAARPPEKRPEAPKPAKHRDVAAPSQHRTLETPAATAHVSTTPARIEELFRAAATRQELNAVAQNVESELGTLKRTDETAYNVLRDLYVELVNKLAKANP